MEAPLSLGVCRDWMARRRMTKAEALRLAETPQSADATALAFDWYGSPELVRCMKWPERQAKLQQVIDAKLRELFGALKNDGQG
jgi:hypothetical protein